MAYNLLTPQHNVRGWWLLFVGLSVRNGNSLHELVQTNHYGPEMFLLLDSISFGFKVLESRYMKWVQKVSGSATFFEGQRKKVRWFEERFHEEKTVVIQQECVVQCWYSIARGTVMHLDPSNYGLSLDFYTGLGWNKPLSCLGIPELCFIWNQKPGSVMGIRGW
jgi:hypothetical protein